MPFSPVCSENQIEPVRKYGATLRPASSGPSLAAGRTQEYYVVRKLTGKCKLRIPHIQALVAFKIQSCTQYCTDVI